MDCLGEAINVLVRPCLVSQFGKTVTITHLHLPNWEASLLGMEWQWKSTKTASFYKTGIEQTWWAKNCRDILPAYYLHLWLLWIHNHPPPWHWHNLTMSSKLSLFTLVFLLVSHEQYLFYFACRLWLLFHCRFSCLLSHTCWRGAIVRGRKVRMHLLFMYGHHSCECPNPNPLHAIWPSSLSSGIWV